MPLTLTENLDGGQPVEFVAHVSRDKLAVRPVAPKTSERADFTETTRDYDDIN